MTETAKREEILKVAQELGISAVQDVDWMWVAEEAALSDLPQEWSKIENDSGEVAYYNPNTKLLVTSHPILDKYKKFFEEQKEFQKTTELKLGKERIHARISQILNEVLNRCHKGFPPVTPELVEQLALVLNVDSSKQFTLCLELRNMLDELAETQYNMAIMINQPINPTVFLTEIRKAVVYACVTTKLDKLMMCQECEVKSARRKCEQCKDFFCVDCFDKTHISGKRKLHSTLDVIQLACDVCDVQHAFTKSLETNENFCDGCLLKKSAQLSGHRMKVIKDLLCSECEKDKATRLCEECGDLFCIECFLELHRRGKRRVHMPLILDDDGQLIKSGVHLPPQVTQDLIAKARASATGGAWIAFKDDQFTTYWYHFGDKLITRQSPYAERKG